MPSSTFTPLPVYVLAGGLSRRFGSDKARAMIGGETVIQRAVSELRPFASRLCVVARTQNAFSDLGLRSIADEVKNAGPLAGIERALTDLGEEDYLLVSACDVLGLKPLWVQALLTSIINKPQVVAYCGQHWWPLPSLWHRSALDEVRRSLNAGELSLWRLIERLDNVALPLPADFDSVINLNQVSDLQALSATFAPR